MQITIGKPYIEESKRAGADFTRLCCDIKGVQEDVLTLWYEVPAGYKAYLCTERSDGFLVAILPFAMIRSKPDDPARVVCEQLVSEKLYHQLTKYYIPVLADSISYYSRVIIQAETTAEPLGNSGGVGTGVSGGVDSSYTIAKYMNDANPSFRLTHGVYYEMGMYGGFDSDTEKRMRQLTHDIAEECKLSFLCVKSNTCLALYKGAHAPIVPSIFMGTALALQKLFSVYYYSSAFTAEQFEMNEADAAYFDLLNVHCFTSNGLSFYSSGIEATRLEKVKFITDFTFTHRYLTVCLSADQKNGNCGRCAKCTRTMAELETIGKLDEYRNVFDVDAFRREPGYHWGYVLLKSKTDNFCKEVIDAFKSSGRKLPLAAYTSCFHKWVKRGFTSNNRQRQKVEELIK